MMDEIPESPTSGFHDAQVPDAVLWGPPTQFSLDQLLIPIELSPAPSPPPAFDRPKIDEEGDGRDGNGNATITFGLGSPENPILVDLDGDEGYTESEPGSVQHPILIEDTALGSDSRPSAGAGPALLRGSTTKKRQQNQGHSREGSQATFSGMQVSGHQDESMMDEREVDLLPPITVQSLEDAPCGDTPMESVAMARGVSRSTDATLTDGTDLCGDTPADETGTILWRHVAFLVVRSPNQGGANDLLAQITLPQTRGGDRSPKMKSLVVQHDPNHLFDVLGYLLALAIHDDVFATGLRDVEEVYRIEIPPHMNDVKLEVKGAKLDLPIFRRPELSLNGDRTPMMIGLLRCYSTPSARYLNTPVFAGGHGNRLSSTQATIPAMELDRNGSESPTHPHGRSSCPFGLCCDSKSSIFNPNCHQSATSMASSHVEGDQNVTSPEYRADDTLLYRHAEDGKFERLQQQIRLLENRVGEIKELVKGGLRGLRK